MPSPFNFPGTLFRKLCTADSALLIHEHTGRSHAALQTSTLLSIAKCATIANPHTPRWSWPDFKRSLPHCRPCGRGEMPHKTTAPRSWASPSACDGATKDCYPHVVKTIACFHPHAHLYTPRAARHILNAAPKVICTITETVHFGLMCGDLRNTLQWLKNIYIYTEKGQLKFSM